VFGRLFARPASGNSPRAQYGYEPGEVDPRIILAVSSLGVLVSYRLRGYALVTD